MVWLTDSEESLRLCLAILTKYQHVIDEQLDIVLWLNGTNGHSPFHACYSSFFQSILGWSVAGSTICCHSSRVVAFLQAVARPKFRGPRSASIARSQVWLGLPAGHFQLGSTCRIHAARPRWWSLLCEVNCEQYG